VNIEATIRDILHDSPAVGALLAQYDFGSGPEPAIFTISANQVRVEDCECPFIEIQQVSATPFGTRAGRGGDIIVDVRCYGDRTQSDAALRNLSDATWDALNRAQRTKTGFNLCGFWASPPVRVSDAEGFQGFGILVRVVGLERVD